MKEYPLVNWKELDEYSKYKFGCIEKQIKEYLDMELWDNKEVLAYNLAFLLINPRIYEK